MFNLSALFHKNRTEHEMDDEMRFHLEKQTEQNVARGMSPEEARYEALRQFGNLGAVKEECRDAWGVRFINELLQDIRYGLRQLRRNPGFTAVAVLTLALGIGANVAIFTMLNGILLKSLPYPQPQRLYTINEVVPQLSQYYPWFPVNSGNYLLWKKRCTAFSGMAVLDSTTLNLTGRGTPRQLRAARVSASFFSVMGIRPQLGRTFRPDENQFGRDHEVILTHQFWEQTFVSNPNIVGQSIDLNGDSYTIVGVLPASFRFPKILDSVPEILKPFGFQKYDLEAAIGNFNYTAIARLAPGVSPQQALAQLNSVENQIARKGSGLPGHFELHAMIRPLKTLVVGQAQQALWMLMVAAGFVLLIVCVNLANLMLVRNAGRVHEMAMRSALGAAPRRLTRQMLTEAVILVAAGGSLGLLFANLGLQLLVRNAPIGIPRVDAVQIDPRVLLFSLGVCVIAVLLFAFLPALRLARVQPSEALKSSGPTVSGGKASARLRGALVTAEIALCGVLLAGAVLLIQSLGHVVQQNGWLEENHVLAAEIVPPPNQYPQQTQRARFYSTVLQKVGTLPGIESAGFVNRLPLMGSRQGDPIDFREAPRTKGKMVLGQYRSVSPGYFNAVGLPLVRGRLLTENDKGQNLALISENAARRLLPGRNPIGLHLMWREKPWEVIGVVGNVSVKPDQPPIMAVYVPVWASNGPEETLVVRTAMDPTAAGNAIRRAVWSVDPQVAIPSERTLKDIVRTTEAPRRYETFLGGLFAICAVLLAALGLYGVIAYSVARRTHEIGIRMALGAEKRDVLKMVIGQGLKLALIGVAIGIAGALALMRFLSSLLYGVKPTDPLTFIAVSLILIAVALLACYVPARRAAKVDPMVALRYE